ncbi:hypothetical protein [Paraburkholderia bryophila]|uniref:Uncharacterized protein n=1 Tax=Paraburkholderia bryophila TaxID=420952 RepID=A0A7Y9W557_9BURK|nr:hypothetical protein [Paraburkholderia bryophila]NYH14427.1 hypothetical protein [Paraburkholderia bryophila]
MCAICDFKIEFSIGHPHALTVAVATRKAIEAGLLQEPDSDGALAQARLKMVAVATLNSLQSRVQDVLSVDELLCLPDFYVLLIETDTWSFFHATPDGFDPDIVPDTPDVLSENINARSLTVVTSRVALQAWLDGETNITHLMTESMLLIDGPPDQRDSLLSMFDAGAITARRGSVITA